MFLRSTILSLAATGMISCVAAQEALVHQAQFPGRDGACPPGYDFNFSNGRCYPNSQHAPGVYKRGPVGPEYGYGRAPRRYGACPPGYDFNYSNGGCYPNGAHAPGYYVR